MVQTQVDGSFMLTYKEGPCINQVHCTCENAVQAAATCVYSEHIHQEPESYSWRNDGLKPRALCKLENCRQPGFLSALCHVDQLSYSRPCICEEVPPLPHAAVSTPFALPLFLTSLVFSEIRK